jgi:GT2 family glycosyltransferase
MRCGGFLGMGNAGVLLGIVTRNRADLLRQAIESALAQTVINMRISVLDDGSTDGTQALTAEYQEVEWTRWEKSHGLIEARNFLMRTSATDYFVSLDDDASFLKGDEISTAIQYLEHTPSAGAVAFDILSPDRDRPVRRAAARPVSMFIGCGHIIRMAVARELGFYQPSPGGYGAEEKDFCLRLIDAGYQTMLLPGVHVWHGKTALERHIPAQHRSGVCNDLVMTFRRTPALLLPLALTSKFYRHLHFSRRHRLTKPCLQGFGLFFRSLPRIWRSRDPVKASALRRFMQLRPE